MPNKGRPTPTWIRTARRLLAPAERLLAKQQLLDAARFTGIGARPLVRPSAAARRCKGSP